MVEIILLGESWESWLFLKACLNKDYTQTILNQTKALIFKMFINYFHSLAISTYRILFFSITQALREMADEIGDVDDEDLDQLQLAKEEWVRIVGKLFS